MKKLQFLFWVLVCILWSIIECIYMLFTCNNSRIGNYLYKKVNLNI